MSCVYLPFLLWLGSVVVSLPRRPERWLAFRQQAQQLGLQEHEDFSLFPAVDGKAVAFTPDLMRLFNTSRAGRELNPYKDHEWVRGVIGCSLSHILLWQEMEQRKDLAALGSYMVMLSCCGLGLAFLSCFELDLAVLSCCGLGLAVWG